VVSSCPQLHSTWVLAQYASAHAKPKLGIMQVRHNDGCAGNLPPSVKLATYHVDGAKATLFGVCRLFNNPPCKDSRHHLEFKSRQKQALSGFACFGGISVSSTNSCGYGRRGALAGLKEPRQCPQVDIMQSCHSDLRDCDRPRCRQGIPLASRSRAVGLRFPACYRSNLLDAHLAWSETD
jgi:predicted metal-binding protein